MCQLLETIRLENGVLQHLEYHNTRMLKALRTFYPNSRISLSQELAAKAPQQGLFKCRVVYDVQIRKVEFKPYALPQIRSLKLIEADHIDYSFKFLERNALNTLFNQRGKADDILIVKNGLITDTSFCNVLFYNGKHWLTPSSPLLKGTRRRFLLEKEIIHTADIRPQDIPNFSKLRLINAMIRFKDNVDISTQSVF